MERVWRTRIPACGTLAPAWRRLVSVAGRLVPGFRCLRRGFGPLAIEVAGLNGGVGGHGTCLRNLPPWGRKAAAKRTKAILRVRGHGSSPAEAFRSPRNPGAWGREPRRLGSAACIV